MTSGFHVPGARVAMHGSHGLLSSSGWMSSLIGPILPLNHTPAPLTFLQVVAKFKALSYFKKVLYPSVCKRGEELSNVRHRRPQGNLASAGQGFLGQLTSDDASFS